MTRLTPVETTNLLVPKIKMACFLCVFYKKTKLLYHGSIFINNKFVFIRVYLTTCELRLSPYLLLMFVLYQVFEVFCNDLATSSALMKSIVDDLRAVAWETECASQHLSTDRSTYKHLAVSLLGRLVWSCSRNKSSATVIQPRVSSYKK